MEEVAFPSFKNKMKFDVSIEKIFRVIPGKFLAGPYPGSYDPREVSRRLEP